MSSLLAAAAATAICGGAERINENVLTETAWTPPSVRALEAWQAAAGGDHGAVFLPVDRHGNVGKKRLSDKAVARIVQPTLPGERYDPAQYTGHSLRAGLATAAAIIGETKASA